MVKEEIKITGKIRVINVHLTKPILDSKVIMDNSRIIIAVVIMGITMVVALMERLPNIIEEDRLYKRFKI